MDFEGWVDQMDYIKEIAASLNFGQYLLIYAGTFILAIIVAATGGAKSKSARESVIAVLALLGGMEAMAYVTIRLGKTTILLAILVLCIFATIIGLPAANISDHTPNAPKEKEKNKPQEQSVSKAAPTANSNTPPVPDYRKVTFADIDRMSDNEAARVLLAPGLSDNMRTYAAEHIQSDEVKAAIVRVHRDDMFGKTAAYAIRSPELRLALYQEIPGLYYFSRHDPLILKYAMENHLYPDDNFLSPENEKGKFFIEVLKTGDKSMIQMLAPEEYKELAEVCIVKLHRECIYEFDARRALDCLTLIYRTGACESMNAAIEELDGQTFSKYNVVNCYGEREQSPGFVFHLFE